MGCPSKLLGGDFIGGLETSGVRGGPLNSFDLGGPLNSVVFDGPLNSACLGAPLISIPFRDSLNPVCLGGPFNTLDRPTVSSSFCKSDFSSSSSENEGGFGSTGEK